MLTALWPLSNATTGPRNHALETSGLEFCRTSKISTGASSW